MKNLDELNIAIFSLKNQEHQYSFDLEDSFFASFENSLLEKGNFKVNLLLTKSESMLVLDFDILGKALLICDRSLEEFWQEIEAKNKIILKFGEKAEFVTEELEIIPRGTIHINVAQYIYEFISLAIPLRKIHPKFRDEDSEEDELIYSSDTDIEEIDKEETNLDEEENLDPRWADLKKLKKKK